AQIMEKPLLRQAKGGDPVARHQFDQYPEHRRVQMHVQVAVDMRQRDTGIEYPCDLGLDFPLQLKVESTIEKIADPGRYRVIAEVAFGIRQAGYVGRRQNRMSLHESQVQPNLQAGV